MRLRTFTAFAPRYLEISMADHFRMPGGKVLHRLPGAQDPVRGLMTPPIRRTLWMRVIAWLMTELS